MRHAEHSAASWQISILAYWHISNLLTMQHYKALFTLGIPIVIGQIGVIILGFADTLMIASIRPTTIRSCGGAPKDSSILT